MLICYREQRFQKKTMAVIDRANIIIDAYVAAGYRLTLRQLHYQMVARNWRENTEKSYQGLSEILTNARLSGLIDWEAIEDRGRSLHRLSTWNSPGDILRSAADTYRVDMWLGQPYGVELWCEKDALSGILESVCNRWDTPFFACRGYTSTSALHAAARRLLGYQRLGRLPVILYLGDHDPSGQDMTRDIADRLALFGVDVDLRRLALNPDQIRRYNPPPQMAKKQDSRSAGFSQRYGMGPTTTQMPSMSSG